MSSERSAKPKKIVSMSSLTNFNAASSPQILRGAAAVIAKNMNSSLQIPTATSVRTIPAKLVIDNRILINSHLKRTSGNKVSFTHILCYAVIWAVKKFPNMNCYFMEIDGKPHSINPCHINLGIAIKLSNKYGNNSLIVAGVKHCETMQFNKFITAYNDIINRTHNNKLTADDLSGVTISLTNPGTIGTIHSVPRLMKGQGTILGVGSIGYPAEFQGTSEKYINKIGLGKIITLTSTYDHRIIQGSESGEFLQTIHHLLLDDDFFDEIFRELNIPYEPIRWRRDNPDPITDKNIRIMELISAYRNCGHLMADIDPLKLDKNKFNSHPDLNILNYGLTLWDLDREFKVNGFASKQYMKLRDILLVLRDAYCRHVGVEYTHILEPLQRKWIQENIEIKRDKPNLAAQKYILSKLNAAEAFETFLQTKYVGQKRFSLEGAETVIPMMDAAIDQSASYNLREVIIGMPHRGRLNVLANIVGKPYSQIFTEFEGNLGSSQTHGSGDVKYHLGASEVYSQVFDSNSIRVTLTANPSHLEAVNPVLEGLVRAKQDLLDNSQNADISSEYPILPLILHGDAAFAGQGIVAETLNLALLNGYKTGGTLHIIVNNQIGFTTAPKSSRSSKYCTDIAKMIGAPIFHVNGDDPEACIWIVRLAVDFRQIFKKDVVVDMLCYRRRGHNEGDDPSMTQPCMYDIINKKCSSRKSYTETLIGRGDISTQDAEYALRDYQDQLEKVFNEVHQIEKSLVEPSESVEADQKIPQSLATAVDKSIIAHIGECYNSLPAGFSIHPRVESVIKKRKEMAYNGKIDWAFAELLALGSLVSQGKLVRLSGQDTKRGTFTQRHAILVDYKTGYEYIPLQTLSNFTNGKHSGGKFVTYNSALSEYAILGFEYGYSVGNPDAMVLWEAQFGDFVNGAQSIIDEFISSGEAKWGQLSGVVLLLPHGHEGQGPDHTSGRIERFLQLWAEGSMTIALPSTPANYFHLLRRHALNGIRRPLVVFTPKSMLRNKKVVSEIKDFTENKFQSVLEEPMYNTVKSDRSKVTQILLCSGKIYYDLVARKNKDNREDIATIRLEQLAPLPRKKLAKILDQYPNANKKFWVQEEPANQGAWPSMGLALNEFLPNYFNPIKRISRRAMSAPSSGSSKVHAVEQQEVIDTAFKYND